jgi:hypothetical protein
MTGRMTMRLQTQHSLILFLSAAMAIPTATFADLASGLNSHHGFGHAKHLTRLHANLVDGNGSGLGEVRWTSNTKNGVTSVFAGVTLSVGAASEYGLGDNNSAAAAQPSLTLTHGGTVYTCTLHVSDINFAPPQGTATDYSESGDFVLQTTQANGTTVGLSFGTCDNFPATLTAGDQANVTFSDHTLYGSLAAY